MSRRRPRRPPSECLGARLGPPWRVTLGTLSWHTRHKFMIPWTFRLIADLPTASGGPERGPQGCRGDLGALRGASPCLRFSY
jgi:hypothetical protein